MTIPEPEPSTCRDCGATVGYLEVFPGPRCLSCWTPIGNRQATTMTAGDLARMWGADVLTRTEPDEQPDDDTDDPAGYSPTAELVESVLHAYLTTVLWSSTDDDGTPLDARYSVDDIGAESVEQARCEVVAFLHDNRDDLDGIPADAIGHDFALTRDHHGAGFWDRGLGERGDRLTAACRPFGESGAYIGDDGTVHLS